MNITLHAGQRFLERVMNKTTYDGFELNQAVKYLEKLLSDVVPTGKATRFVLPCFEDYKVIYKDGSVITIVAKSNIDIVKRG